MDGATLAPQLTLRCTDVPGCAVDPVRSEGGAAGREGEFSDARPRQHSSGKSHTAGFGHGGRGHGPGDVGGFHRTFSKAFKTSQDLKTFWGAWVAQLVRPLTLTQVTILWSLSSSPASGSVLAARILASDSVSPSLSVSPPLTLCLCISIINKS